MEGVYGRLLRETGSPILGGAEPDQANVSLPRTMESPEWAGSPSMGSDRDVDQAVLSEVDPVRDRERAPVPVEHSETDEGRGVVADQPHLAVGVGHVAAVEGDDERARAVTALLDVGGADRSGVRGERVEGCLGDRGRTERAWRPPTCPAPTPATSTSEAASTQIARRPRRGRSARAGSVGQRASADAGGCRGDGRRCSGASALAGICGAREAELGGDGRPDALRAATRGASSPSVDRAIRTVRVISDSSREQLGHEARCASSSGEATGSPIASRASWSGSRCDTGDLQSVAHSGETSADVALDRPQRHVQLAGDLLVGEVVEERESDDLAGIRLEALDLIGDEDACRRGRAARR